MVLQVALGLLGGAKGLGNVGFAGIALNQIQELLSKSLKTLTAMSPSLRGSFTLAERSFQLLVKPFADFLGNLLRPAMQALFEFSAYFNETVGPVMEGLGEAIGKGVETLVINPIKNFFSAALDIGKWLGENLIKFFDLGYTFSFAKWFADNIIKFFDETSKFDFGKWLKEKVDALFKPGMPPPADAPGTPASYINNVIGGIVNTIGGLLGGPIVAPKGLSPADEMAWLNSLTPEQRNRVAYRQLGSPFIDRPQLAMLHRGEAVVPANEVGRTGGSNIMITNRMDFSDAIFKSQLDIEDAIRRGSRDALRAARRRGLV